MDRPPPRLAPTNPHPQAKIKVQKPLSVTNSWGVWGMVTAKNDSHIKSSLSGVKFQVRLT